MSGIEVAGLVLGAFPILVKCLEEYRRVFEPLDEWWRFQARFIVFLDGVRHQTTLFYDTMLHLLDPIIPDKSDLLQLASNPSDARWNDGSLTQTLRSRHGSELDRLVRIINCIHQTIESLYDLLLIKDGQVSWLRTSDGHSRWEWHLTRFRLALNKKKHKRVKELEVYNQTLRELLGCSERILTIATRRGGVSESTRRLEEVRQHTVHLFNVLRHHWACHMCQDHEANLKLDHFATISELQMLLLVRNGPKNSASCPDRYHRICVRGKPHANTTIKANMMSVPGASDLSSMQSILDQQLAHTRDKSSLPERVSVKFKGKSPLATVPWRKSKNALTTPGSSTTQSSGSTTVIIENQQIPGLEAEIQPGSSLPLQSLALSTAIPPGGDSIQSLCVFLEDTITLRGTLSDKQQRQFELTKSSHPHADAGNTPTRLSLHEMLDAYHKELTLELPRQTRFLMAAHIASALLQANHSPWLLGNWSKRSFYFLINPATYEVESSHAFVSRSFPADPADMDDQVSEDVAHQCLRNVGIMIMELVFGHSIEDSRPYMRRCRVGPFDQQAYLASAREWQVKLISESGPQVAGVVTKCLTDFGFGQRPRFSDPKFRETIYKEVVEPLVRYRENWATASEN